jgi:hypothetical protein
VPGSDRFQAGGSQISGPAELVRRAVSGTLRIDPALFAVGSQQVGQHCRLAGALVIPVGSRQHNYIECRMNFCTFTASEPLPLLARALEPDIRRWIHLSFLCVELTFKLRLKIKAAQARVQRI